MRKSRSLLLYFFIGLVVVGLGAQLIRNPGQLITSLLILLGITFIMFFVLRAVLNRRQGNDNPESKKYRDAVKQSQKKYEKPVTNKKNKKNKKKKNNTKKRKQKTTRKRTSKIHLKLIKGHKTKSDLEEKNKDSNK